jgi:hypothetical protein
MIKTLYQGSKKGRIRTRRGVGGFEWRGTWKEYKEKQALSIGLR